MVRHFSKIWKIIFPKSVFLHERIQRVVRQPNSENCSDLILLHPFVRKLSLYQIQAIALFCVCKHICHKGIVLATSFFNFWTLCQQLFFCFHLWILIKFGNNANQSDVTGKHHRLITFAIRKFMLDMPSTGGQQNKGLYTSATGLKSMWDHVVWVKISGAQLKINLHSHWMLIKAGKRTMMIRCILKELLRCKVHEKCLCLLMSALFWIFGCNNSVRKHQVTMVPWQFLIGVQCTIGLCKLIFNWAFSIFTWFEPHAFTWSEPSWRQIWWPIFQKLPGTGTSKIDFLSTDVI